MDTSTTRTSIRTGIPYLNTVIGVALVCAGGIHWLILMGVLEENAPFFIMLYFHSLAVFDILAGVGVLMNKRYGYIIMLCIALTQIPAHGYMLMLDMYQSYGSDLSVVERIIEILLSFFLTIYTTYILRNHLYQ